MNKLSKSLLSAGLISASLFSCSKENDVPAIQSAQQDLMTFNLSAEVDPVYEYDDEAFRAAKFTAEDSPRIVLEDSDINGGTKSGNEGLNSANTLNKTTIRINWFALDTSRPGATTETIDGLNTFKGQQIGRHIQDIRLSEKNGNYHLDMKIIVPSLLTDTRTNKRAKYKDPKYTFYGNVFLGGWPGAPSDAALSKTDERGQQFYSRVFSTRNRGGEYSSTHPNHRIDELDGTASKMARRHFPLVGRLIKLRIWDNPNDPSEPYGNRGGSTGQIVSRDGLYLEPRGTIFTLTLENETGQNIKVTDIEVPHRQGTRGQAFSFEGKFSGSGLNPTQSLRPTYHRFDGNGNSTPVAREDVVAMYNVNTLTFPVYNKDGQAGIDLAPGATSGRLMVWAYAHNPAQEKPFTVRVRYTVDGQTQVMESKFQTVTPPAGGFKEGKAYRATLKVKPL